jgi:hypothetical protein
MSLKVMSTLLSAMSKVIIRIVIVSFMGKVKSRGSEKCFTRIGSGLTPKPWTGLEGLAKDKNLLGALVKSFITLAPDFKSENIFETFSFEG